MKQDRIDIQNIILRKLKPNKDDNFLRQKNISSSTPLGFALSFSKWGWGVILFCLLLQSCSWFFHAEDTYISTLNTVEDYTDAINGAYGILAEKMASLSFFYPNTKGDDLYNNTPNYSNFYSSCWSIGLGHKKNENTSWEDLYKVIASTNNMINQYNEVKSDNRRIQEIIGEAYLLRSYCYFRLVKIYGTIPLIENIDVSYTVPLSTSEEIYEFIELDLQKALSFLPDNRNLARISAVTPHRGTAKAILAEVYLSWAGYPVNNQAKYEMAAKEAGEVIDSANYFGFALEEDLASLWSKGASRTNESVFCVYFTKENQLFTSEEGWNYFRDNIISLNGFYNSLSYWAVETDFYNSYSKDYRREVTFLNDIYYVDFVDINGESVKTLLDLYIDSIPMNTDCEKIGFRKFFFDLLLIKSDTILVGTNMRINSDYFGIPNLYIFRYAQTLLTFVEASARSGNLNEKAHECLNMIRRRANNVDLHSSSRFDIQEGLSAEVFADSVVQERAWELAGEPESRWSDQLRLGLLGNDSFIEIPEGDVILNPNLGGE